EEVRKQAEHALGLGLADEVGPAPPDLPLRRQLASADDRDALLLAQAGLHRFDVAVQDCELRLGHHAQFRGRVSAGRERSELPPRGPETFLEASQKGLALLVVAHPCGTAKAPAGV